MKHTELYYREPRHESFPPRHRTTQPKPMGSLNAEAEERIVMLYASGQSIETITREVGRARHLIVHLLQSRGVFGKRRTEPVREEPWIGSVAAEEQKKTIAVKELELDPVAVEESEPEIAIEKPSRKVTRLRKSKAPVQLKSVIVEKPKVKPPVAEKVPVTDRWSPQVVDALFKVAAQSEIDPEMSIGEVKRIVSGARQKDGRKR
jgi:hypothetical protein